MLKLISDNFLKHATGIPELCSEMQVIHLDHLTYVNSGLSCDTFNIVYIHSPGLDKEELIRVLAYYKEKNLDYCIWTNKECLTSSLVSIFKELKIELQASEVGMAMNLVDYVSIDDPRHANIVKVKDETSVSTYANVIAENWTPADQNVLRYYNQTASHYLYPENKIQLLIYYHEGLPASCVEIFPTDSETVGFYGFATLEAYRGMGIGTSLLTYALNRVKMQGYKNAILQGTENGLNIYKRYGFTDYTTYYEFV